MTVVEESAEAYSVRGADFQLAFRYVGDRWQHFISLQYDGEWVRLLCSEEGSPDTASLPSPALQDLRLEKLSETVVEFQLLGQAGKGVYSAAVRFDGQSREIDFDLCARGRSSDSPLCGQSGYLLGVETVVAETARRDVLAVRLGDGPGVTLAPVGIPSHPPTVCRIFGKKSAGRIAAGSLDITHPEQKTKGVSIRWRYRITPFGHP